MRNTKKVTKAIRGAGRELSSTPAAVAARHRRLIARAEGRRLDAILDSHFRKGHTPWNDPDHHRAADVAMPVTEAPATAVASLEDTIFSDDVMHDAGVPSNANAALHGSYVTTADIEKARDDGFVDQPEQTEGGKFFNFDEFYEAPFEPEMTIEERIASGIEPAVKRDRSAIVAEMCRQRNAPKSACAVEHPPSYSVATQDAAKMRELITQDQERNRQFLVTENGKARECLTECAKIMAAAIVRAARMINGDPEPEDLTDKMFAEVDEPPRCWHHVGMGTPLNTWLETRRCGIDSAGRHEAGTNETMCLMRAIGDEAEWVDRDGRTTVTHSTFLPPTHWRWPAKGGEQ